jgi:ribosome-associated protein
MDMKKVSSIADYFIISSGTSGRHIKAVADSIEEQLKKQGYRLRHKEGYNESEWVLLDYNDCIVHIFSEPTRKFYDLERLWGDAPRVLF